jgi:hypothetical protein
LDQRNGRDGLIEVNRVARLEHRPECRTKPRRVPPPEPL